MSGDIHTCNYQCERPACIREQRDELVAKLDAVTMERDALREALRESCANMETLIPLVNAATDRIAALTDQGRAGEGSGG